MRNFTKGYKVYNQLQNAKTTGEKTYLRKCVNAIMDYHETNPNTNTFSIVQAVKLLNADDFDALYTYCSNWLKENDEHYDGENWYGESYQ